MGAMILYRGRVHQTVRWQGDAVTTIKEAEVARQD